MGTCVPIFLILAKVVKIPSIGAQYHREKCARPDDFSRADGALIPDPRVSQPCFSFLWIAPIPPSHGSDERNQFCFFGTNSRRCRRMPTRTM